MGTRFLRHVERTSVLLHLLDISRESNSDAWGDFETVNRELTLFSPSLMKKPQVVAINKIDLPIVRERIKKEIDIFERRGIKVLAFSAVTGEGIDGVLNEIARELYKKKVI